MIVKEKSPDRASLDVPAAPTVRSRRNPKWVALGVIAVCIGAIASFVLYSELVESEQVVAVRTTVHRGSTITAEDLGVVSVGDTGGVATVPAAGLEDLVGGIAGYDLVGGSLLPAGAVTTELPPGPGMGIVGIRVSQGRAPAGYLPPGSPVQLVVLPPSAGGEGASVRGGREDDVTNVATIRAVVVDTQPADDGILINLELKSAQAVDAASYAAQQRIAVIRQSER